MKKRGQVTIFIIIAIVLVASVVLFFAFKDKLGIFSPKSDPVYLYVENCIRETGEDAIHFITQNGGYLFPPTLSTSDGIPYYYSNDRDYTPTKERIEEEISDYIKNTLSYCTNEFTNFQDLNISEGEVKAETIIEDNNLILSVKYPITIEKGGSITRFEDFNDIKVDSRIGVMYNSIKKLIQDQIGKEDICLSCISEIVDEEGFTIDMTSTTEGIIFTLRDEHSKIKDVPVEWRFANEY